MRLSSKKCNLLYTHPICGREKDYLSDKSSNKTCDDHPNDNFPKQISQRENYNDLGSHSIEIYVNTLATLMLNKQRT